MAITNTTVTNTGPANVYASSGNTVVATAYIYNRAGATILVEVYAVPSGGTADANTQIYGNVVISATDTYVLDTEKLLLGNNDAIMANCNVANGATFTVSYTGA